MTLIATHICRHGIVHASDSNVTDAMTGDLALQGPKTFAIPHLNSGLCIMGSYHVGGVVMHEWMPDFISQAEADGCATLAEFSERLRIALETGMVGRQPGPMLVHIAGYARDAAGTRPEFHFVRNTTGIGVTQ